ncbi:hypothetical protein EYC80_001356 [Monilinia laxa]|uniref:Uncharacterized protein n=1 Tax=Monilinia laxa TaxID=61186 RepID=A0A5N6K927_MONLA|nr:hypothetical protein EYC80_001356 [Monilinia laxa]
MESRRRLGRRRMAHVTEMTQAPMYDPGAMWCSSWGPEKVESQWKAPTPRITEQSNHFSILPSWLTNFSTMSGHPLADSTETTSTGNSIEKCHDVLQQERCIKDHFDDFEMAIRAHRQECNDMISHQETGEKKQRLRKRIYGSVKAMKLCLSFSERLEHSLTLGLVSSDLLSSTLQAITDVLIEFSSGCYSKTEDHTKKSIKMRGRSRGTRINVTTQLLVFYTRVWKGIVSCKVLKPADFESEAMGEYLSLLARLPSTKKTQLLVSKILPSLSVSQLLSNTDAILSLLNKWTLSWLKKPKRSIKREESLTKAEESVAATGRSINHLSMLVWSNRDNSTPEAIQHIRDILIRTSTELSAAKREVFAAENIIIPYSHSVHKLSTTLATLPGEVISTLVGAHSELISSSSFFDQKSVLGFQDYLAQSHRIRFNWLCALSKSEKIDDTMFMGVFKSLQLQDLGHFNHAIKQYTLTQRQTAEIILNRWTSQGVIRNGNTIIDTFKLKTIHSPWPYGWLLSTLERHGQLSDEKIRDLLDFLLDTREFRQIDAVLKQSKMFNMQVKTSILADLVNNMTSVNLRAAYNIYMQQCLGKVEPEACAPLIASMIYQRGSKRIWAALDAPIYAAMPRWKRKPPSRKVISQARIELVHEMAKAFAHSKVHNPRKALRNVTQCLHYLRAHDVQLTSEISTLITQVGITTDVKNNKWGRTERVRWVLKVIEVAEGPEVADVVRKAVMSHNPPFHTYTQTIYQKNVTNHQRPISHSEHNRP